MSHFVYLCPIVVLNRETQSEDQQMHFFTQIHVTYLHVKNSPGLSLSHFIFWVTLTITTWPINIGQRHVTLKPGQTNYANKRFKDKYHLGIPRDGISVSFRTTYIETSRQVFSLGVDVLWKWIQRYDFQKLYIPLLGRSLPLPALAAPSSAWHQVFALYPPIFLLTRQQSRTFWPILTFCDPSSRRNHLGQPLQIVKCKMILLNDFMLITALQQYWNIMLKGELTDWVIPQNDFCGKRGRLFFFFFSGRM